MKKGYNKTPHLHDESAELRKSAEVRDAISPEKRQAYDTLTRLGMLRRLADMGPAYHGRSRRSPDDKLRVNSYYDNRLSRDGRQNVHHAPTFFATPDVKYAEGYAEYAARHDRQGAIGAEVDKIVSSDPNAMLVDVNFDPTRLSPDELAKYRRAMAVTTGTSDGTVGKYLPTDTYGITPEAIQQKLTDVKTYVDGAFLNRPGGVLMEEIAQGWIGTGRPATADQRTWLAGWMRDNHIVGLLDVKYGAASGRLGTLAMEDPKYYKRYIEGHSYGLNVGQWWGKQKAGEAHVQTPVIWFVNLDRTKSQEQLSEEQTLRAKTMGRLALWASNHLGVQDEQQPTSFIGKLNNEVIASSPKRLVAAAADVPQRGNGHKYAEIFDRPTGVWEGYTLRQHTETALRNFENNYADEIPAKLLPLARLSLVVHDIGKPEWADKDGNNKHGSQENFNQMEAFRFMKSAGVNKLTALFVNRLMFGITYTDDRGAQHTLPALKELAGAAYAFTPETKYHREPQLNEQRGPNKDINTAAEARLAVAAKRAAISLFGTRGFTNSDVAGIMYLAMAVQTSDAGAYTHYATTDYGLGLPLRNAGSFDESFARVPADREEVKFDPLAISNYNKESVATNARPI